MRKFLLITMVLGLAFSMHSCIIPKKMVYLKDMVPDSVYHVNSKKPLTIQTHDRLGISISATNPELALPFNQATQSYKIGERTQGLSSSTVEGPSESGYLVNESGNVEIPVLGDVRVEGLTLEQIKQKIKSILISKDLIKEPIVGVELLNLKIILMGELGTQVITIADSRMNIFEALSRSGGVTSNAKIDQLVVIREEEGERKMYLNDLRSEKVFDSPTYHLKQNDIVYAVPRTARMTEGEDNSWRYLGFFTGTLGFVFSVFLLLQRGR